MKLRPPTTRPCLDCVHYEPTPKDNGTGWCNSIKDRVEAWWTGCVRHKERARSPRGNDATDQ